MAAVIFKFNVIPPKKGMSAADDPQKTRRDELLYGPSTAGKITIIFSFNHNFITRVIWCSLARQRPISFPLLIPVSEAKLIKRDWRDGAMLHRKWPTSIFSFDLDVVRFGSD